MKKTGTILALAVAAAVIAAGRLAADPGTSEARSSDGHRSLFSLRNNGLGGYGGPHFKATVLNGRFAVYGGGPIMVILDGCWGLGLSVSTPDGDAAGLDLYYGCARIERIFFPGSLFYWSLGGTAAAGCRHFLAAASRPEPAIGGRSGRLCDCGQARRFERSLVLQDHHPGRRARASGRRGMRLMFLGRRLLVGAGGYRPHEGPEADGKALGCMYGGLWTEYDLQPDALVHLSFGGLIAMGGAGYEESGSGSFVSSGALVLDPEIHLQVNLTEIMRLSLGAGYRCLVLFDDLAGMDKRDFNGPAAIVQLRFLAF